MSSAIRIEGALRIWGMKELSVEETKKMETKDPTTYNKYRDETIRLRNQRNHNRECLKCGEKNHHANVCTKEGT
jgi:hypothetical protein